MKPIDEKEPEKWREDFPVQSERDDHITRRDFTRFLLLISAGFATGNGIILGKAMMRKEPEFSPLEIATDDELQPGAVKAFNYPDTKSPSLLIRRLDGQYVAYSSKCTHLACPVAYSPGDNGAGEKLECHCHQGEFDIATGKGTAGPPRELRPLPRVDLEIRDGKIFAIGISHGARHA
jgi:arsenite oxidase small subunit